MGTIKTTNIEPIADNGTVTLGSSGDTFALASGVTQTIAVNTPAFLAKPAVAQSSISDDTLTKISFTEVLDTANGYNGSRFTPGVVGYYQVNAMVKATDSTDNGYGAKLVIYKNGSIDTSIENQWDGNAQMQTAILSVAGVIYLDADDYIEVYASFNTADSGDAQIGTEGQFSAYKLIGT